MSNHLLSRGEKILIVMYRLGSYLKKNLKFEDIVVGAFKSYPEDFHLRGYPEYPDSGDAIHKPLYDFRKKGLVEVGSKVFRLTDRGIAFAKQLSGDNQYSASVARLSRYAEKEALRVEASEGFNLFKRGETESINDSDFYAYLAVTPRTPRNDFLGRLETIEEVVKELETQKDLSPARKLIAAYHQFLMNSIKFKSIVDHFKSTD
jgi:hypothetical protein